MRKKTAMLGKYLPNSLAVHAVMLNTQQDSAQIRLQHHRNEVASARTGSVSRTSEPAHIQKKLTELVFLDLPQIQQF